MAKWERDSLYTKRCAIGDGFFLNESNDRESFRIELYDEDCSAKAEGFYSRGSAYLSRIAASPRRRGCGSKLHRKVEEYLACNGVHEIKMSTLIAAMKFNEAMGFEHNSPGSWGMHKEIKPKKCKMRCD